MVSFLSLQILHVKLAAASDYEGDVRYFVEHLIIVGPAEAQQPTTTTTPTPTESVAPTETPTQTATASPTVAPQPDSGIPTETPLIAGAAVIIVIAVIAAALVLRKHK